MSAPVLYPENEPTPFWPLIYLGQETLEALYPYIAKALEEDMVGGRVEAELTNLCNAMRAHLQHFEVYVD